MKSATLVKSIIFLTLIMSGPVIAAPPTSTSTQLERIIFTLAAKQPTLCSTPPILDLKVIRGKAIQGSAPGHHVKLIPAADSFYAKVFGIPDHLHPYDPNISIRHYADKVISKDGSLTLKLKGAYNVIKQTNNGTWTANNGCHGTFVDTKMTSLPAT